MVLFMIDEDKCKRDGICARECPMAIIKLKDGDFPKMVQRGKDLCNDCGHCVAVCPHGALTHTHVPIEKSPLIKKELEINEEQAVQFLRSRRSIRRFKEQPVEKEKLQRLIEIARYAPTAGNLQLVEWTVFTDPDKIKEISRYAVEWMHKAVEKDPQSVPPYFPGIIRAWDIGYDSVLWSAPALVVASSPAEGTVGLVDVTLALSYLELAAPKLGLGTCWIGLVEGALQESISVKEAVGLPDGHFYHYPMIVGYPKLKYIRLPERKTPKITWK